MTVNGTLRMARSVARRLKCIRYDPLASCLQGRRRREAAARALITRGAKVNRLQSIAIAAICRGDYGSDMFRLLVEAGLDLCCRGGVCTFDTLFGCTTNYHDVALLLTLCLWERCQGLNMCLCHTHIACSLTCIDGYDSIRYLATDEIRKLARAASYVPLNHRIASGPLFLETILWSEYDHLWITRALILVAAGACLSGAFSTGGTVRDAMLRDWRKYAATANCTEEVIAGFPRMLAAPTQCEARRIALELLPPGLRPDRPQKLV